MESRLRGELIAGPLRPQYSVLDRAEMVISCGPVCSTLFRAMSSTMFIDTKPGPYDTSLIQVGFGPHVL